MKPTPTKIWSQTLLCITIALAAGPAVAAGGDGTTVLSAPAGAAAQPAEGRDDPATFLPSLDGSVGLYRVSTAEVGPLHHLRFALHGQYFASSDFLVSKDNDSELAGALSFGFTPLRRLELYGGLYTSSNRNQRTSEPGRTDPEVIRSHGDLILGAKVAAPVTPALDLGFETGLRFLAGASNLAFSGSSTSLWLGPLATLDLRPLAGVPLRFHANASFYLDNSKNVYDLTGTTPASREAAKFAYGILGSRMRLAAAVDAPIEKLTGPVPLRPFAEYHLEVITGDADPALVDVMPLGGSRNRQWMTFGLRAEVYKGATVDVGTDLRLQTSGLAYGPPLPPYTVLFGASYPLDVDAFTRPVIVTRTVDHTIQLPPPAPNEGSITGIAKDREGKPIGRAVVVVAGRAHAGVVTDADGTFLISSIAPGPAKLDVSAAGYEAEEVTTAVTAGKISDVSAVLTPKPHTGSVRGKTTDAHGRAVEATLRFSGAQAFETRTDGGGLYQAVLAPGPYTVVAEAPGLPTRETRFDVIADTDRQIDLTLRPLNPALTLTGDEIVLRAPIKFRSAGAPRLTPEWQGELDGVAAALDDHPEIHTLRIEAHWDSSAGSKAKAITLRQANVVKDYLVSKGVAETRLETLGFGADQPLVPSLVPSDRQKNRRLELHMVR
jgi:outer membrane protein OmpA-like peptidoglycan-associated protein